jgi:hypothetical protein
VKGSVHRPMRETTPSGRVSHTVLELCRQPRTSSDLSARHVVNASAHIYRDGGSDKDLCLTFDTGVTNRGARCVTRFNYDYE